MQGHVLIGLVPFLQAPGEKFLKSMSSALILKPIVSPRERFDQASGLRRRAKTVGPSQW